MLRKFLCLIAVLLSLQLTACGEDQPQPKPPEPDWDKLYSAERDAKPPADALPAASHGGVKLSIAPQNPVAGDCLVATVKGKPADRTFIWEINGVNVQHSEDSRYCLINARRDDIVTVSIGDATAGGAASVKLGNSLPRVADVRIELVPDGAETYIELTPEIEDADEDYVSLDYQWLINGEVNDDFRDNRHPSSVYRQGDAIQVRITPDDGFGQGPVFQTRDVNVPNAAPLITSRPPGSFESLEYSYRVAASDPDGDELIFTLEEAPEGMTIDTASGEIAWPLTAAAPGDYRVKIVVSDPLGSTAYQEFTINLGERRAVTQE